jgi:hypothetical protein
VAIVSVRHSSLHGAVDVSLTYDNATNQFLSVDLKASRFSVAAVTVTSLAGVILKRATRALDAGKQSIDVRDLGLSITTTQTVKGSSWQLNAVVGAGRADI